MSDDFPTDSKGNKLVVGDFVAFNRSGNLDCGTICSIVKSYANPDRRAWTNSTRSWKIYIATGSYRPGYPPTARVRNTNGIMLLRMAKRPSK